METRKLEIQQEQTEMEKVTFEIQQKQVEMKTDKIEPNKVEEIKLKRPVVFLNYCGQDEIYAAPLKDIIEYEHIDHVSFFTEGEQMPLHECEMMISVITPDFMEDMECKRNLKEAQQCGLRRVSILFVEEEETEDEIRNLMGESIEFHSLGEEVCDYLMTALYYLEPFQSCLGRVNDALQPVIQSVLRGFSIPPRMKVGDRESVLVGIGSMGYSTIHTWMKQGFDIQSQMVLAVKSETIKKGQPDLDENIQKWVIEIENDGSESGNEFLEKLNHHIRSWLQEHVQGRKLVLLGGLGKTTASLLLPLILRQADRLGIATYAVCTMPLSFEPDSVKKIARRSFGVLQNIAGNMIYYDNSEMDQIQMDTKANMRDLFNLAGYAMAVAVNLGLENHDGSQKGCYRIDISEKGIVPKRNAIYQGSYGKFDVTIAADSRERKPFI